MNNNSGALAQNERIEKSEEFPVCGWFTLSVGNPLGCLEEKFLRLNDETLYQLCKTYGERARLWRQKFAGLLPEVYRRKLYEKKGFSSVFEFAKKLAGMGEEQVRLVLNLEKRFEKTPILRGLLVDGKVSVNKLARIASIANRENEIFLAGQVQVLSKSAVETLVRDEKFGRGGVESGAVFKTSFEIDIESRNGLQKPLSEDKSLPGQTFSDKRPEGLPTRRGVVNSILNLSSEVEQKLLELQEKGIDINSLLLEFLRGRDEEIAEKKAKISQKITEKESVRLQSGKEKPPTRYISRAVQKILHEEHGKKCSVPNCQKPSTQIHHTQRFSVFKSHNPKYLAPLCKEHHQLAHSADLAYYEIRRGR